VREPRRKENQRVVHRLNVDKRVGFFAAGKGIDPQNTARERFREPVKVIDSADDPANDDFLTLHDGIAMFGEESTVAMRDHSTSNLPGSKASVPSRWNIAGKIAPTRVRNSFFRSPKSVIRLDRRMFTMVP
jgi:hypothetical protein